MSAVEQQIHQYRQKKLLESQKLQQQQQQQIDAPEPDLFEVRFQSNLIRNIAFFFVQKIVDFDVSRSLQLYTKYLSTMILLSNYCITSQGLAPSLPKKPQVIIYARPEDEDSQISNRQNSLSCTDALMQVRIQYSYI